MRVCTRVSACVCVSVYPWVYCLCLCCSTCPGRSGTTNATSSSHLCQPVCERPPCEATLPGPFTYMQMVGARDKAPRAPCAYPSSNAYLCAPITCRLMRVRMPTNSTLVRAPPALPRCKLLHRLPHQGRGWRWVQPQPIHTRSIWSSVLDMRSQLRTRGRPFWTH